MCVHSNVCSPLHRCRPCRSEKRNALPSFVRKAYKPRKQSSFKLKAAAFIPLVDKPTKEETSKKETEEFIQLEDKTAKEETSRKETEEFIQVVDKTAKEETSRKEIAKKETESAIVSSLITTTTTVDGYTSPIFYDAVDFLMTTPAETIKQPPSNVIEEEEETFLLKPKRRNYLDIVWNMALENSFLGEVTTETYLLIILRKLQKKSHLTRNEALHRIAFLIIESYHKTCGIVDVYHPVTQKSSSLLRNVREAFSNSMDTAVLVLLNLGVDVNTCFPEFYDTTFLHTAVAVGRYQLVSWILMRRNVSTTVTDVYGRTAFHLASKMASTKLGIRLTLMLLQHHNMLLTNALLPFAVQRARKLVL